MPRYRNIGCLVDRSSELAVSAYNLLTASYHLVDVELSLEDGYDVIITLGGDGMMLKALHMFMGRGIPVFGLNRGSIGFLLNQYDPHNLIERLNNAIPVNLFPLEMSVTTVGGESHKALAINEVSLLRQTNQSAKIKISINDHTRLDCLISDGVLVSTPAGSSAYNFAAHGPIIPLSTALLALTPISPFRPRQWNGALLLSKSVIQFDILEHEKRPVSAVADSQEVRDVLSVRIIERSDLKMSVLFDKSEALEEKVIKEQFVCA